MARRQLSTAEAAELLGRDSSWVRALAARGQLKGARKIGRDWVVSEAAVLAYQARGLKAGRPRKVAPTP